MRLINSLPENINVTINKNELVEALKFYTNSFISKIGNDFPEHLNIQQLSKYLNYSKPAIYKMVGESSIPYYKVHSKLLFKKSEIDEWLLVFKQPTTTEFISSQELRQK